LPLTAATGEDFSPVSAAINTDAGGSGHELLPVQVDGRLLEPAWEKAERHTLVYPWSKNTAPATEFRAMADAERLYFAFEVADPDLMVTTNFMGESTLDQEDRVEIFFARDAALSRYYCLEIDL
jgi:hypothetical protein